MSRQFYANNYKLDELNCNKNRCACAVVQYAQKNNIKIKTVYNSKTKIEKIGFTVADVDLFAQKQQELCEKCK